jgi:hypothetical protein
MDDCLGDHTQPRAFGTVKIRGKRYDVVFTDDIDKDHDACIDAPSKPHRKIYVRPHIAYDKDYLMQLMLHKSLHGGLWDLDEEAVDQLSRDQAAIVRRVQKYKP